MANRAYNFNPGPAALPHEVLKEAQETLVEIEQTGMSLMEMSHRSKYVEKLNEETQELLLELMGLHRDYRVLFMGGGASTQFALIPLNFLLGGRRADYLLTGSFSEKAFKEAGFIGETHAALSSKDEQWRRIPDTNGYRPEANCAYVHITTNNTIEGSRYTGLPVTGEVPLIGDMTSDILSRKLDFRKFSMLYAGAQKNLGPAGVTAVIIREDLLHAASKQIPLILRYETFSKEKSLYNTPPVHAIYMMNLVLKWTKRQGGIEALERLNAEKAKLLYDVMDASGGFYQGKIDKSFRSDMNVTWAMKSEELERRFIQESEHSGFEGLAGHRSVGGLRASAYNAVPLEACKALADYMKDFQRRYGS